MNLQNVFFIHDGKLVERILKNLSVEGESIVRTDLFPHIKRLLEDHGVRYVVGGQGRLGKLVIIERGA